MKQLRLNLIAIFVILLSSSLFAQEIEISESTQISLLTCSPGPAGYEKFGHTAIRVFDPMQSVDYVANWGLFDFEKPNFYYNFVKGETYYLLGIHPTNAFLYSYEERNSSVTEQVLKLSDEEKQDLIQKIVNNYQPQNREYLYNFVFDNCATRPRDMILDLYGGNYRFESDYTAKSFRQWIAQYSGEKSWMMFGIDLVFGRDADQLASRHEAMFLPEVLEKQFQGLIIENDTVSYHLVEKQELLIQKRDEKGSSVILQYLISPLLIISLLLIIGVLLTIWETKKKKRIKFFDFLLFFILGIAGIIALYLAFFSIHPMVNTNYNLIWVNPLYLILAFALLGKSRKLWKRWFFVFMLICNILALVFAVVGPQVLNIAFLPLIALIIIRLLVNIKH